MAEQENNNSFKEQNTTENLSKKYMEEMMDTYKKSNNFTEPEDKPIEVMPETEAINQSADEIRNNDAETINEETAENTIRSEEKESFGYLLTEVTTASGSVPIEDAVVIIHEDSEKGRYIHRILRTDISGRTPVIELPAPMTQTSGQELKPFYLYNIKITANNFYPTEFKNVPVFSGIKTIQQADLIPLSEFEDDCLHTIIYEQKEPDFYR